MDDSDTTGSIPTENSGVPAEAGSSNLSYRDHEVGSDQHDDQHDDRHEDPCLRRVADYIRDSLDKADAFEATLGAVNGQLMRLAYRQSQALEEALTQGPADSEQLEHLTPAVDQFLKVTKQIGSYSGLAIRLAKGKEKASNLAAATVQAALPKSEESGI